MGLSNQLKVALLASVSAEALSNVLWTSVVPFVFKCLLILLYTVFIVNFYVFVISPINAAAPALTGSWAASGYEHLIATGCHTVGAHHSNYGAGHTTTNPSYVCEFNASNSSTIYGNADTVLPESYSTRWFIKF